MFTLLARDFFEDLTCREEAHYLKYGDFDWYDKDGFELNSAEKKFIQANKYELSNCLNHWAWHCEWLKLDHLFGRANGLHLDHCMLLHRGNFADDALAQISCFLHPGAIFMTEARCKWGLDFAVDHVDSNRNAVEVLHIELDDYDLNRLRDKKLELEQWIMNQDWLDLAARIRKYKNEWQHLKGFAQNDWKANFLLGWTKAEYTEKSFNFF